jgi:hypothetical protein
MENLTRRSIFSLVAGCGLLRRNRGVSKKFGLVDGAINPYGWLGRAFLNGKEENVIRGNDVQGWVDRYVTVDGNFLFYRPRRIKNSRRLEHDHDPGARQWVENNRIVERVEGDVRFELKYPEAFHEYREMLIRVMSV